MSQVYEKKHTFEYVAQMLKDFREMQRRAQQLIFEIENYIPAATGEDMIDAITFNTPSVGGVNGILHNGQVADKTANIAISYAEKVDKLNVKHKKELENDLKYVNVEILRLEHYISLLDDKHSKVLRMLYIEGLTYAKTAEKYGISTASVRKLRKTGISKLTAMFDAIVK